MEMLSLGTPKHQCSINSINPSVRFWPSLHHEGLNSWWIAATGGGRLNPWRMGEARLLRASRYLIQSQFVCLCFSHPHVSKCTLACRRSECPRFDLEDDRETYQVRTYEKSMWVETNVSDTKYELAYTRASAKLLRYFKGNNENETKMDLTTPTLAALKLDKDAQGSEKNYTFGMWLNPDAIEDEAPEPKDEDLQIVEYPEVTVYSRSFGGFATEASIMKEVNALHEELTADEEDFDKDYVFALVYDPAIKLLNRHNEVHVMSAGQAPSRTVVSAS